MSSLDRQLVDLSETKQTPPGSDFGGSTRQSRSKKMSPSGATSTLTLKQFMLRQQVIRLYREFFRATAKLEDGGQKEEIRSLIRADFKANQSLDTSLDEDKVKSLLFHGEKMLRELQQNVDLSKA